MAGVDGERCRGRVGKGGLTGLFAQILHQDEHAGIGPGRAGQQVRYRYAVVGCVCKHVVFGEVGCSI